MNRRTMLAAAISAIPLAACQTPGKSIQRGAVAADIALIAGAMLPVLVAIQMHGRLQPGDAAIIASSLAAIQAAAQSVAAGAATDAPGAAVVKAVQAVAPIVARALPLGSIEAVAFQAVIALLPALIPVTGAPMAPAKASMDPTRARAILRGSAP